MRKALLAALLLVAGAWSAPVLAQAATISQSITGTRLDVDATAEVTRVPDIATISAGVVSRATTASSALQDSAERIERVLAALKRAGIEDRDIQTGNVSLSPEYRYENNQAPQLVGYTATNSLNIRFRDVRSSGRILDALVAQGANQINGPTLALDNPEAALDEARAKAVVAGRARAELYARSLGMHIVRLVALSETGGPYPAPGPVMAFAKADTRIEPGEQKLAVGLHLTFELQ